MSMGATVLLQRLMDMVSIDALSEIIFFID